MVVGCAITLKPFIRRFMPNLLSSPKESAGTGNASGNTPNGVRSRGINTFDYGIGSRLAGRNHIRVDSSFTADYDGRISDEELGGKY
jgi:hypothetical protein